MNLPELYNRVTAKRPELCVPQWKYACDGERFVDEATAAALILAKWVEALPVRHGLDHHPANNRESEEWQVRWYTTDNRKGCGPCEATPLEAIAAFYLDIDSMYWHQQV